MRGVSRTALALAAIAAAVASAAWSSNESPVAHATVSTAHGGVELWRDPLDGELALRVIGGDQWTIVRGQTLIDVDEGNLEEVAVHATAGGIWRAIRIQYR